jgi:hypothetical protein
MAHDCTVATLTGLADGLINSNLDENHLAAAKVLCLGLTVMALHAPDYVSHPAILKRSVADYFAQRNSTIDEIELVVLAEEAVNNGFTGGPYANRPTALRAVNALFSALSPKELRAAEVFLRCVITEQLAP